MTCGGDVRTSAGGVVVGGMMLLVAGAFADALVADVLLPEHTQEAPDNRSCKCIINLSQCVWRPF